MTLALWFVATAAAVVPVAITIGGLWHLHRRMDTLAHATAGVAIGAVTMALVGIPLVAYATALVLALFWEWLEPRLHIFGATGPQDTEADIGVVVAAAALIALLA
jgi:hypothetical protein